MFDKLVDLLVGCVELFRFWYVLQPYEQGVLLRLGKFVRVMEPGFHWVFPFCVDIIHAQAVVPSTHSLGYESITTKDNRSVAFHAIVTYQVRDIKKALLDVSDTDHAVRDACAGEIGRVLHGSTWEQIIDDSILETLSAACRKRGFRYGIEIMSVQLASLSLVKNLRIMGSTQ